MVDDILQRAEARRQRAWEVLRTLNLLERWAPYGQPVILGAMRMGLMVALDIDMEIYSRDPQIAHGFQIMSQVAQLPGVWKVRFSNEMAGPDQGLYWQIRYRDGRGEVWKVDQWLMALDHPDAHLGEALAEGVQRALTDETRRAILEIKEALLGQPGVRGIDVYRAVLEGGVRGPDELRAWLTLHRETGISHWLPKV